MWGADGDEPFLLNLRVGSDGAGRSQFEFKGPRVGFDRGGGLVAIDRVIQEGVEEAVRASGNLQTRRIGSSDKGRWATTEYSEHTERKRVGNGTLHIQRMGGR